MKVSSTNFVETISGYVIHDDRPIFYKICCKPIPAAHLTSTHLKVCVQPFCRNQHTLFVVGAHFILQNGVHNPVGRGIFLPFGPRSLQQIRMHKNHNCGTVTSYHGLKWSSIELVHCRNVNPRGCTSFSRAIQVCVGEALLFWSLIWRFMASGILSLFDTTHHAVVLGATLVLPIRTGTTAEVVKARCNNCSSKLCLLFKFSPFEPRSLCKYSCTRMTTVGQPPASRV